MHGYELEAIARGGSYHACRCQIISIPGCPEGLAHTCALLNFNEIAFAIELIEFQLTFNDNAYAVERIFDDHLILPSLKRLKRNSWSWKHRLQIVYAYMLMSSWSYNCYMYTWHLQIIGCTLLTWGECTEYWTCKFKGTAQSLWCNARVTPSQPSLIFLP
jgi:hypothetical protein